MTAVEVNDAKGKPFTRIILGETVARALQRINFPGLLENSNGIALLGSDLITAGRAPYVFKSLQQLQQDVPLAHAQQPEKDPFQILSDLAVNTEAPSTFGKTPVMNEQNRSRIHSWRPPRIGALPAVLACKAFSDFIGDSRNVNDVEACDCKCVRRLAETMPGKFKDEKEREKEVQDILGELLNRDWSRPMAVDTDGSLLYNPRPGNPGLQAMILNLEVKKEKGSTASDCGVQNIGYFLKYWGAGVGKKYFPRTCLPTLLLQVEGPTIFCSGAVFHGGRVCVDPLSPAFHMLELRHDESSMLQLAALMRAIRRCVPKLEQIYFEAVPAAGEVQVAAGAHDFPYLVEVPRIDGTGTTVKFRYDSRVDNKLAFKCVQEDGQNTPLFVKFSSWGYSQEAHEILAGADFAPKLLALRSLPCGITVVVMHFVEHAGHDISRWDVVWRDQLREAVSLLHAASLVHGDLRELNMLFATRGRLQVVDFDFSGHVGVARYPWALTTNNDIQWPDGVEPRALLKKADDLVLMNRLLDHDTRKRARTDDALATSKRPRGDGQ